MNINAAEHVERATCLATLVSLKIHATTMGQSNAKTSTTRQSISVIVNLDSAVKRAQVSYLSTYVFNDIIYGIRVDCFR